jgi:hypothetical protein
MLTAWRVSSDLLAKTERKGLRHWGDRASLIICPSEDGNVMDFHGWLRGTSPSLSAVRSLLPVRLSRHQPQDTNNN